MSKKKIRERKRTNYCTKRGKNCESIATFGSTTSTGYISTVPILVKEYDCIPWKNEAIVKFATIM
jgi:hypothetical protein